MSNHKRREATTSVVRVRSRWDDCDQYGHVNNAAYLAIVRAAHDRAGMPGGILRTAEITYREPLPAEVMVDVDVAVREETEQHRRVTYTLRVDGRTAAEVSATWSAVGAAPPPDLPPMAATQAVAPSTTGRTSEAMRSARMALHVRRRCCNGSSTPFFARPTGPDGHGNG